MKKKKDIILPLGCSCVVLIISSIILYLSLVAVGIYVIMCGSSDSGDSIVAGIIIIVLSVIIMVTLLSLIYRFKIEFEGDNLLVYDFERHGLVRNFKFIFPLNGLIKIEKSGAKTLNFIYANDKPATVDLKSFGKKQIPKIISVIVAKAKLLNGNDVEVSGT